MFKKRLEKIKQETARELLLALYRAPEQHLSAEGLGEVTQLRSVAYPHLARLHSEGLVEPKWVPSENKPTENKPKLGYALTDKGKAYIASELADGPVTLRNPPPGIKPLVARLSAWFG